MSFVLIDTFFYSMLIEITGALFSGILLVGIGWGIYYFTHRRHLVAFFSIKDTKRLIIYLSNLRVISGGSIGIDGVARVFSGTTVVISEQIVANEFRDRFNYLMPSLSDSPSILSKILFADIHITSVPSPLSDADIETNCSIIALGSPAYNKVSGFIENIAQTNVKFNLPNQTIDILNIPPINGLDFGFIQRLVVTTNGVARSIFYTAGLSELGTIGAAKYLSTHWKSLFKKFGSGQSFIILLKFPTSNLNNFNIIMERSF